MIRRLARLAFVACVVLVACGGVWEHTAPAARPSVGIVRFDARAFRPLWRQVEDCAGVRSDFNSVRWYVTLDSLDSFPTPMGPSLAVAYPGPRVIVIARLHLSDTLVIRHEAMHLIASPFWHRKELYQVGPCAPLVICVANCLTDTLAKWPQPRT